jgi:hypothetical protein
MPDDKSQLALPFYLDEVKLKAFLTRWLAIEDEEERLREDKRLLKEDYADAFPMRGVLTAVKVIRAQEKLIHHPKEPMQRRHLAALEGLVQCHLLGLEQALEALTRDAETTVTLEAGAVRATLTQETADAVAQELRRRAVPDMTGEGAKK